MDKEITLVQLVECLQLYLKAHGNQKVVSIGTWSGKHSGLDTPFNLRLKSKEGGEVNLVVPAFEHDVEKFVKLNFNFIFDKNNKSFRCRCCKQEVGWEYPDLPGHFWFSSCSEGDETRGICYDCWSKDRKGE